MKILQKGRLEPGRKPWWQECLHQCAACRAEWLLEDGDAVDVRTERCPNGESIASSACPMCGTQVQTRRSSAVFDIPGAIRQVVTCPQCHTQKKMIIPQSERNMSHRAACYACGLTFEAPRLWSYLGKKA
jgi:predicted RNA-binding Zn-ribbon protein involved in translation (DUF1610 family)